MAKSQPKQNRDIEQENEDRRNARSIVDNACIDWNWDLDNLERTREWMKVVALVMQGIDFGRRLGKGEDIEIKKMVKVKAHSRERPNRRVK